MDNGHPTVAGTKALLTIIDQAVPIIRNPKFVTTERLYNGVATAYRYGCLNCLQHLKLNCSSLCPVCVNLLAPDPSLLTEQGDTDGVSSVEVQMAEKDNKRLSPDPVDSTPSKHVKSNDGHGQ